MPDEYSDAVARKITSSLQKEFQDKNNIMFFVKDEFDGTNTNILEGYSTADNDNRYYENLLEKFTPDFFIQGNYSLSKNSLQQTMLCLQSVNIKNYYFKSSEGIKKIELKSANAIMSDEDKTANIKTQNNIWANGKATYYEKAEENSVENLISKIASQLQTKFLSVKPQNEGIADFSKKIIKTYQYSLSDKIKSKVISEEDGNCEIVKYISKDALFQIFDEREITVKDYIKMAQKAENELRIADALLNNYRALVLLKTLPDNKKIKYNFGNGKIQMYNGIKQKIKNLLISTKFAIASSQNNAKKSVEYTLNITYKNKPVQNIVYKFWTGKGYSPHIQANNGIGTAELFGASTSSNQLKCKIEYMFTYKKQEDLAFAQAIDALELPRFQEATVKISANKKTPIKKTNTDLAKNIKPVYAGRKSSSGTKNTSYKNANNKITNLDTKKAGEIIKFITDAIKTKQYASVKNLFTTEGYDMFIKLIKYGNAKVINYGNNYKLVQIGNRKIFRFIPMKFSFGKKVYIENVTFSFNKENKINNVSFALSNAAVDNIMRSNWDLYDKFELLTFMENYKTAYQLERIDYIKSIFSEKALIIIGNVLKYAPNNPELHKVEYKKYTKKEYIQKLDKCFKANKYINLRFEETTVKQGKLKHVYGIQLNQIYSSSNYADKGYLFLLIDLRNKEKPLIHVRTWQPDKNPDGSIFGVGDFYFD